MNVINSRCGGKYEQNVYKENKLLLQLVASDETIRQAKWEMMTFLCSFVYL